MNRDTQQLQAILKQDFSRVLAREIIQLEEEDSEDEVTIKWLKTVILYFRTFTRLQLVEYLSGNGMLSVSYCGVGNSKRRMELSLDQRLFRLAPLVDDTGNQVSILSLSLPHICFISSPR